VRFVDSNVSKAIAFQTRAMREKEGWSQQALAEKIGSNQNAVYRAENPNYGKQTITTLKKIAGAFDVALIVRFVPFSELTDWVSGTPRTIDGLTTEALTTIPSFDEEEKLGIFDKTPIPAAKPISVKRSSLIDAGKAAGNQPKRTPSPMMQSEGLQHAASTKVSDLSWLGNSEEAANRAITSHAKQQRVDYLRTSAQMGAQQFILPPGNASNALEQPVFTRQDTVAFTGAYIKTHRKWSGANATEMEWYSSDPAQFVARRA
jgi:transcriptional regulator with XRE-family HTH domain